MSAETVAVASSIESKKGVEPVEMDAVLATLKTLEVGDLFKVLKQAVAAAEKRSTGAASRGQGAAAKKTGSMPKGVVPPQLRKPRAWVDFTLQHALTNGWESFTVFQSKKNKETGETIEEEIVMPGSELYEGAHIYEGSVSEKYPSGRQLIHKDAMSLSKQRWAPKAKVGTHEELYNEFLAGYVEEDVPAVVADDASVGTESTKKTVVRMTAAEKAADSEAKKAAKEAEKAVKKAEKEAERAAKKAEKEAEKAAKKAEKEAEKAAAKEAKEAEKAEKEVKKPVVKASVPTAAIKKPVEPVEPIEPVAEKAAAVPAPKKKPAPKVEERSVPNDGMVHPCTIKGKKYLRNAEGETWLVGADDGIGAWAGIYDAKTDKLDTSAPEPVFDA